MEAVPLSRRRPWMLIVHDPNKNLLPSAISRLNFAARYAPSSRVWFVAIAVGHDANQHIGGCCETFAFSCGATWQRPKTFHHHRLLLQAK